MAQRRVGSPAPRGRPHVAAAAVLLCCAAVAGSDLQGITGRMLAHGSAAGIAASVAASVMAGGALLPVAEAVTSDELLWDDEPPTAGNGDGEASNGHDDDPPERKRRGKRKSSGGKKKKSKGGSKSSSKQRKATKAKKPKRKKHRKPTQFLRPDGTLFPEDRWEPEEAPEGVNLEDIDMGGVPLEEDELDFDSELGFGSGAKKRRAKNEEAPWSPKSEVDETSPPKPGEWAPTDECVACLSIMEAFAAEWVKIMQEFAIRQNTGQDTDKLKAASDNRIMITPEELNRRARAICDLKNMEPYKDFVRDTCPLMLHDPRTKNWITKEFVGKFNDAITLAESKLTVCVKKTKMCRRRDILLHVPQNDCGRCRALMQDAAYLARRTHDPDSGFMPSLPVLDALCERLDFRYPDLTTNFHAMDRFCEATTEEYEDEIAKAINAAGKAAADIGAQDAYRNLAHTVCTEMTGICEDDTDSAEL